MKTPDGRGVMCDKCGLVLQNNFSYFSHDLKKVSQTKYRLDYFALKNLPVTISSDLCSLCDNAIRELVIKHHEVTNKLKHDFHCDISGIDLKTVEYYYHVAVTSVSVSFSNQVSMCKKCGTALASSDKECKKCKSINGVRKANVNSINNIYEYNICQNQLDHVKNPKLSTSEWSAKS